jgi:hypothetical protein
MDDIINHGSLSQPSPEIDRFSCEFRTENGILHGPFAATRGQLVRFVGRFPEDDGKGECGAQDCKRENSMRTAKVGCTSNKESLQISLTGGLRSVAIHDFVERQCHATLSRSTDGF